MNLPSVPRLRGRLHQAAFFVSLPLGASLVALARTGMARVASLVFAVSLSAVFAASAAYHRGDWSDRARRWMRRLDHSMIFVLIAGTYTPFCLLVIGGGWGLGLLVLIWAGAAAGIILKLVALEKLRRLGAALYLVLGWLALLALPLLIRGLTALELSLVVAGGVLYTLGAVVLLRRRPNPSPAVFGYHEIWHALGVAAGGLHYVAVLLVVSGS